MLILLLELLLAVGLVVLVGEINSLFISSLVTEDEVRRASLWVSPLTEEVLKYATSLAGFGWLYGVVFTCMEFFHYFFLYHWQKSIATLLGFCTVNGSKFIWLRLQAASMHLVTVTLIWRFGVEGMLAGMLLHHCYNRINLE